jgi:hypothetical protein
MKLSSSTIRDIAFNLALDFGLRRATTPKPPKPSYKFPAGRSTGIGLESHPFWDELSEDAKAYLRINQKPSLTKDDMEELRRLQVIIKRNNPRAKFVGLDQNIEDLLEAEGKIRGDRPRSFERMTRPKVETLEESDAKAKRKAFLADKGFLTFKYDEAYCEVCQIRVNSKENAAEFKGWKSNAAAGLPCPVCAQSELTGTRLDSKAEYFKGETADINPKAQLRAIVHDAPRQISTLGAKVVIHPQYMYIMDPPISELGTILDLDEKPLPNQDYYKAIKSILMKFKETVYGTDDVGSISKLDLTIAYDYTYSNYLKGVSLDKFLSDVKQNKLLEDSALSYAEETTVAPSTPFDVDAYIKERKDDGNLLISPSELASLLRKNGIDIFLEQQADLNPVTKRYPRPLSDTAQKEILTKYFESNGLSVGAGIIRMVPQIEAAFDILHESGLYPALSNQQFTNYILKNEKARDIQEMLIEYLYDNRSVLSSTFGKPAEVFRKDSLAKILESLKYEENPTGRDPNLYSVLENFLTDPELGRERIETGIDTAVFNLDEVESILKRSRIPVGVLMTFINDAGLHLNSSEEIADKYKTDRILVAKENYLGDALKSKNINVLKSIFKSLKTLGSAPNISDNFTDLSYSDIKQAFEFMEASYRDKDKEGNDEILDVFVENGLM